MASEHFVTNDVYILDKTVRITNLEFRYLVADINALRMIASVKQRR